MKATIAIAATVALIVGAATATADVFITGSQIADGTITEEDLDPDITDPTYQYRVYSMPPSMTGTLDENEENFDPTTVAPRKVHVACPAGTRAINGGIRSGDMDAVYPDHDYPTRTGWMFQLTNVYPENVSITLYAICL